MRVLNSSVIMTGDSSVFKSYTKEASLRFWVGNERPGFEGQGSSIGNPLNEQLDTVELSDQAKEIVAQEKTLSQVAKTGNSITFEISEQDKQKLLIVQKMLEVLTGKKVKFYILKDLKLGREKADLCKYPKNTAVPAQNLQGWGLEYDYHESYYEQGKMSFTAQGIVKTADGREINFSVQLSMSREFAARHDISIRAGDAVKIDPLVINFSGTAPELTNTKFSFDLDSDGKEDQISFAGPGSGFLAIDLDGDGRIDNGGELFGPDTGDGFAELAKYDADGNNWIDENDSIYDRLRIWTKDQDGRDVLFVLGQKGIGAIFLGNASTPFEMKDRGNNLQGQVKSSGIFLYESGLAGTIQQIDLAV